MHTASPRTMPAPNFNVSGQSDSGSLHKSFCVIPLKSRPTATLCNYCNLAKVETFYSACSCVKSNPHVLDLLSRCLAHSAAKEAQLDTSVQPQNNTWMYSQIPSGHRSMQRLAMSKCRCMNTLEIQVCISEVPTSGCRQNTLCSDSDTDLFSLVMKYIQDLSTIKCKDLSTIKDR